VSTPSWQKTTSFWWLEPSTGPDQSSSTRFSSGGVTLGSVDGFQARITRAARVFARNGPIGSHGTPPENSAALSTIRTSVPAAAFSASTSVNGR
jgi:hypothetical protein